MDPLLIEQYNTPGFTGCLSRVQFNGIAPIKWALRSSWQRTGAETQPDGRPAAASPVSHQGKLVESNCGASPLTIPPMSAATDPWHLDSTGETYPSPPVEAGPARPPSIPARARRGNASVKGNAGLWAKRLLGNLQ